MDVQIIKEDKNELEATIDNQTIVEIVRSYLNKDSSVKLAAWKKEHYSKPLILKIRTEGKTARKAFSEAIAAIQKDLDKYKSEFSKAK